MLKSILLLCLLSLQVALSATPADSTLFFSSPCDSAPELNRQIVALAGKQMGTTVGRGECWDLAALVMRQLNAKWNGEYVFGRKVDPEKDCIFPGDIIQFEGVKLSYRDGNRVYSESMPHHTAIVNEVRAPGIYVLIHQNTAVSGRTVGLSNLRLNTIISGKYTIYRPERKVD